MGALRGASPAPDPIMFHDPRAPEPSRKFGSRGRTPDVQLPLRPGLGVSVQGERRAVGGVRHADPRDSQSPRPAVDQGACVQMEGKCGHSSLHCGDGPGRTMRTGHSHGEAGRGPGAGWEQLLARQPGAILTGPPQVLGAVHLGAGGSSESPFPVT